MHYTSSTNHGYMCKSAKLRSMLDSIEKSLPILNKYIEDEPDSWQVSLSGLMSAKGYLLSRSSRNIDNFEEVLFTAGWS